MTFIGIIPIVLSIACWNITEIGCSTPHGGVGLLSPYDDQIYISSDETYCVAKRPLDESSLKPGEIQMTVAFAMIDPYIDYADSAQCQVLQSGSFIQSWDHPITAS